MKLKIKSKSIFKLTGIHSTISGQEHVIKLLNYINMLRIYYK